jgi:hypothetical protein
VAELARPSDPWGNLGGSSATPVLTNLGGVGAIVLDEPLPGGPAVPAMSATGAVVLVLLVLAASGASWASRRRVAASTRS